MNVLPEELPRTARVNACTGNSSVAGGMTVVNPLQIPGWDDSVSAFPEATVFHSSAWLRVLCETYRHTPRFLCRFSGNHLLDCLPLAEVCSPLTGRRAVSLPFSDFCPALLSSPDAGMALWEAAKALARERRWKYLELRSADIVPAETPPSLKFYGHELDLRPGVSVLESRLIPSVRRALRKSRDAGLRVEIAGDLPALRDYYQLHCLTRRRHGLPPQPFRFFERIATHLLSSGQGIVVTARDQGRPVASAVFCHFGARALYKFGASDYAAQHLRPNNLVIWEGICYYARREFESLHLGRTSPSNEGLRRFKCSFGAREHTLACFKYDVARDQFVPDHDRAHTPLNALFRSLPLPLLRLAGRLLYPHLS